MRSYRHDERNPVLSSLLKVAFAAAAVLSVSGCMNAIGGGRGGSVPYDTKIAAPDTPAQQVASSAQPIGVGDSINVNVFQVESLSGDFKVDQAGKIDYPLLGMIQAQGRTTDELSKQLAASLSQKYLNSPNIQVAIKDRAEQKITVDGSVQSPGMFTVKGPTTLLQAVAMARGTTEDANPSRVVVFRTVGGQRVAGAFDLKAIRRAQAEDPVIYGNDIVIVDGNPTRQMFRDLMTSIPLLGILRPF